MLFLNLLRDTVPAETLTIKQRDTHTIGIEELLCSQSNSPPEGTSSINLSGKNLELIPFGVYMLWESGSEFKELDVSNNQLTEIPYLLRKLGCLEKLDIHNNPKLNHLPDFLWKMYYLKELKIDGKLIRDLPKKAKVSLKDKKLENQDIIELLFAGKNNVEMSDEALAKKTVPYTVYLK